MPSHQHEIASYGDFPSYYMGLVTPKGGLEHYDGVLRIVDSEGRIVEDGIDPAQVSHNHQRSGRTVELSQVSILYQGGGPWGVGATTKLASSYRQGMYRVGPLARLNICTSPAPSGPTLSWQPFVLLVSRQTGFRQLSLSLCALDRNSFCAGED